MTIGVVPEIYEDHKREKTHLHRGERHTWTWKSDRVRRARPPSRYKIKEMDEDLHRAAATVTAWNWEISTTATETSVENAAENLRRIMTAICDTSMPWTTLYMGRSSAVYWWTPDIAELRTRCVRVRRWYQWACRRRRRAKEEVPCTTKCTACCNRSRDYKKSKLVH